MRTMNCLLLLLVSCLMTAQSDGFKALTPGTTYQITVNNPAGQEALPGSYVFFHATMKSEADSVLFSTYDGGPQKVRIADSLNLETASPIEVVLAKMRAGETASIKVSLDTYPHKPPGMENDSLLIYVIEVVRVIDEETFEKELAVEEELANARREVIREREQAVLADHDSIVTAYRNGTLPEIKRTESGLGYVVHQLGEGKVAEKGDRIEVHYVGSLIDGTVFDQSFIRGEGITFSVGVGQVIPGWDEGLMLLPAGTRATFFIPSELGYGEQGTPSGDIPPNAEMVFYVEVVE